MFWAITPEDALFFANAGRPEAFNSAFFFRWGDLGQLGGFVWCTTGGGKTMTSFKAGQLITDKNLADKVVFVVDRKVLDEQSTNECNSFHRQGESVCETTSAKDLFQKLKSSSSSDCLIVTSIQKISRINDDAESLRPTELEEIRAKRIVFIIDDDRVIIRTKLGKARKIKGFALI